MLLFWKVILGYVSVGLRFGWWKIEKKMETCLFEDGRANVSLCSYCHSFQNFKWTQINYQVDFTSWLVSWIVCRKTDFVHKWKTKKRKTTKWRTVTWNRDRTSLRVWKVAIQGRWRHEVSPESRKHRSRKCNCSRCTSCFAANSQNNSLGFFQQNFIDRQHDILM